MYDEYMTNFLGYPGNQYQNTYDQVMPNNPCGCINPNNYMGCSSCNNQSRAYNMQNVDLENYYPEIYRIIYPMVKKACESYTGPINEENINKVTEELYSSLITNERIELNINLNNRTSGEQGEDKSEFTIEENRHNKTNNLLSDLIKILIIRELIVRPRNGFGFGFGAQATRQMPGPGMPPPPRFFY